MFRLDQKLANIRAGRYKRGDFMIADAKDPDMGPSIWSTGPKRAPDGSWSRYHTRAEFLDRVTAIIKQDIVDIMLVSASNLELLTEAGAFRGSAVKPAIRANDASDIWVVRGGGYAKQPSRPFRSASLQRLAGRRRTMNRRRLERVMCDFSRVVHRVKDQNDVAVPDRETARTPGERSSTHRESRS